jgi:beta-xylosidase
MEASMLFFLSTAFATEPLLKFEPLPALYTINGVTYQGILYDEDYVTKFLATKNDLQLITAERDYLKIALSVEQELRETQKQMLLSDLKTIQAENIKLKEVSFWEKNDVFFSFIAGTAFATGLCVGLVEIVVQN